MVIQNTNYNDLSDCYCYDESNVLVNLLDIRDYLELDRIEHDIVAAKIIRFQKTNIPGSFDFDYFLSIHKYLFDRVYEWAGKIRNVNITKGDTHFCPVKELSRRCSLEFFDIKKTDLTNMDKKEVALRISNISKKINELHPFREGNGRTLRTFITMLLKKYNYNINYDILDREKLLLADIQAMSNDLTLLCECYEEIIF